MSVVNDDDGDHDGDDDGDHHHHHYSPRRDLGTRVCNARVRTEETQERAVACTIIMLHANILACALCR